MQSDPDRGGGITGKDWHDHGSTGACKLADGGRRPFLLCEANESGHMECLAID